MAQGVALLLLRADVQQGHPGLFHPQHPLGVVIAQIGKLHQVLRRALSVGAAVAQDSLAAQHGDDRAHGGPADTPDALDQQRRAGQQCAGRPGGDEGVALPRFQEVQSHRQGGVLFHLKSSGGVVGDLHHLAGVFQLHAGGQGLFAAGLHSPQDLRRPAH